MGFDHCLDYSNETDKGTIYWRRAMQIHYYFERVCGLMDDCEFYDVKKEDIIKLKELCDEVVANPEKAEELLPLPVYYSGYSVNYDEWYFSGLKETSEKLEKILDYDWFKYSWW